MKDKGFFRVLAVIGILFAAYAVASLLHAESLSNILSPACTAFAFAIVCRAAFAPQLPKYRQWLWLCFAMAFLFWTLADVLWAVDVSILGKDPENDMLVIILYFCTNVCLLIGTIIYAVRTCRKWNALQLIVDAIAISASILFVLWVLFFDKNIANMGLLVADGWISPLAVGLDIGFLAGVAVWFFSIRSGKISAHLWVLVGSIMVFAFNDLLYYYFYTHGLYHPNSLVDVIYVAALFGVAAGVLMVPAGASPASNAIPSYSNVGRFHKGLLLLPAPLLIILAEGFNITDFLISLIIIIIHEGVSNYIQTSIQTDRMVTFEKTINADLEHRIAERTQELEENLDQLDSLSKQDSLTGLFNRRFFLETLDQKILQTRPGDTLSLLFFDIDRFKIINDSHGHAIGDQIICELARRLQDFASADTLLSRLGGDEFVIAFQGKYSYDDMRREAIFVIKSCSEPIQIGQYLFHVTISAGVSIYPLDAENCDALMRNSDMAMYLAKKEGYGKVVCFNDQLKQTILRKNDIEILLKKAELYNEFQLYYQPQFSISDRRLVGMEALLRWNCPDKGFISPAEFIPIAEETNSIIPIGAWVLSESIHQIAFWNKKYGSNLKMGINVSPKQLDQIDFSMNIQTLLLSAQVPPEWIDVEITEGVAVEGKMKVAQILQQFRSSGITVSIDDFGTGYSSLSYLKLFPIQRVKLALQLIDNITVDRYDMLIVSSIILMATSIGIKCIAEGVETKDQFDLLNDLGCEQMQGFYLGKPMPPDEFEEIFLKTHKWE